MVFKTLRSMVFFVVGVSALFLAAGEARSVDVVDFVVIPEASNMQAGLDVILACENGIAFGFNAKNRTARLDDSELVWDVSFANEAGLLIKEYPLALGESPTPLQLEGHLFPYRAFHTLLWSEMITEESITTCVAGAGTGFCEFRLPINDCHIESNIVANIVQFSPDDTTPIVSDQLVYEVQAYDPAVGTENGAGIEQVDFKILDYGRGLELFSTTVETTRGPNGEVSYCAFSPNCDPWDFMVSGYTWPNGEQITSGVYLLRVIVSTPDGGKAVIQQQFELRLQIPPDVAGVAGGEFTIGTVTGTNNEAPVHTVAIDDFWIMQTEVTNGQYRECVEAASCTKPEDDTRWNDPAYAEHPVVNINWQQANDYAAWLGGRLPSEVEWEAACRGVDARAFPWGSETPTDEFANFNQALGDTKPVGSYPAGVSPYGLLDMSGNVWEWTNSLFAPYPYVEDDGREERRSLEDRMARGGSFYYTQYQLTCTGRTHFAPESSTEQIGLRVVFDKPMNVTLPVSVHIETPADNAVIASPVEVVMAAEGLVIEEAGELRPNAGHFHLLVDTDFVPPDDLIPFDDNYHHFGDGSTTALLELEPGAHVLRLQFANGAHVALAGDQYRDEIAITVE